MLPRSAHKPRTKPAEERRDDLMNSAERLFLEKGAEPTTIEEITQGADVAKGTFYLHFSSKADVLEALRSRFVQGVLDAVVEGVGRHDEKDWGGKLAAWAKVCAVAYLDAARLHHLVFASTPSLAREGLTRNILIDHLTHLLADGAREKAWSVNDPRFTAILLFNALHGVVSEPGVDGKRRSRRKLLRAIDEHFLRSLGLPWASSSQRQSAVGAR
jgi:AcrR family transcriptional regulator